MKFIVVFTYMDGEEFEIQVHPNDMEKFIGALDKSEVFFNNSKGVGVWVPIDKIRYFHVERVDANGKRVVVSDKQLQNANGETSKREGASKEEGKDSVGPVVQAIEAKEKPVPGG